MRRFACFVLLLLLAVVPAQVVPAQAAPAVEDLAFSQVGTRTRVTLSLSEPIDFRATLLDRPKRVVIELPALVWGRRLQGGAGGALVASWQAATEAGQTGGPQGGGTTRITLLLGETARIASATALLAGSGSPARLVVDLETTDEDGFRKATAKVWGKRAAPQTGLAAAFPGIGILRLPGMKEAIAPEPAAPNPTAPKPGAKIAYPTAPTAAVVVPPPAAPSTAPTPPVAPARLVPPTAPVPPPHSGSKTPGVRLVVLDAGHGGVDPGAESVEGYYEKEITIATAAAAKSALEATGRYKVVLTRPSDDFVALQDRVSRGRAVQGELFVSLHADSTADGGASHASARGASVYTLSGKASDAQSERYAQRENRADLLGGLPGAAQADDVASILVDLTMRETMANSNRFAAIAVRELQGAGIRTVANPHRSAGFAVLKAPDMPSVLIEMGYLSDTTDARLLAADLHQKRFAQALLKAIDRYFAAIAAPGSGPSRR